MQLNNIGIIGLSVMGSNLAKNFASKGFQTAIFNRTYQKTQDLLKDWEVNPLGDGNLIGFPELKDFIASLERPRKIILMVKSGLPVDEFIEHLLPLLEPEDIILDCGNSNWRDTIKRQKYLESKHIQFIGCGVSGGEEGALHGPSIMPGGDSKAVQSVLPLLQKIAAKDFTRNDCVVNVGLGAAGHFVKMVHNGIEYAIMQGVAETYDILKHQNYSNEEIKNFFEEANSGELKSFLLDITVDIFGTKDKLSDGYLIDKIDSRAGAKGTGKWAVEAAMDLGVAVPSISAAVFARIMSAKEESFKIITNTDYDDKLGNYDDKEIFTNHLSKSLAGIYIASYYQGLDLIFKADKDFGWGVNIQEVIRIWQGGCIIRSKMLENLYEMWIDKTNIFDYNKALWFSTGINYSKYSPRPVMYSALDYFATLVSKSLPQNLIQAQRDFFGAHTYNRIDREGVFTGGWN